jgi:hypothetical protein
MTGRIIYGRMGLEENDRKRNMEESDWNDRTGRCKRKTHLEMTYECNDFLPLFTSNSPTTFIYLLV